jgi:hypothetical protein
MQPIDVNTWGGMVGRNLGALFCAWTQVSGEHFNTHVVGGMIDDEPKLSFI